MIARGMQKVNNTSGQFPCVPAAAPLRHPRMPVTPSVRRCARMSYMYMVYRKRA